MTWSEDSRFLAFWAYGPQGYGGGIDNLSIYDTELGSIRNVPIQPSFRGGSADVRLSPSGDGIAFQVDAPPGEGGGLYLMNSDGTKVELLMEGGPSTIEWHPDGTRLFFGLTNSVQTLDLTDEWTGRIVQTQEYVGPTRIYSYDLERGTSSLVDIGDPAQGTDYWPLTVSPDGNLLAYLAWGDTGFDVYVIGLDGSTPRFMCQDCDSLVWSPDSRFLEYVVYKPGVEGFSDLYVTDSQRRSRWKVYSGRYLDPIAWLP